MRNRGIFDRQNLDQAKASYTGPGILTWDTRVDHFNASMNATFPIRYMIDETKN